MMGDPVQEETIMSQDDAHIALCVLLIEAAQECGYATFQGIRDSWEWQQVVAPMVENKEDQILGFAALQFSFS